jgi:hypothetical protein
MAAKIGGENVKEFCFDVDTVAAYLHSKKQELSPYKLQFALYLIYAHHAGFYLQQASEGVFEGSGSTLALFAPKFVAAKFGPELIGVKERDRKGVYENKDMQKRAMMTMQSHMEEKTFIDEWFERIDAENDFRLINLAVLDPVWREAYDRGVGSDLDISFLHEHYKK